MPFHPRHSSLWLLSLLSLTLGACQASSTGTPIPNTPSASVQPTASATPTPEPSAGGTVSPPPTTAPSASPVPLPTPSGAGSTATINLPDGSRLVLTLPNRFLTDSGQSVTVSAQLLDANGQPLPLNSLQLLYSSSRPQDFSISDQGVITSLVNDGYSTITVRINGTELSASQLISVSALSSGGGGGGGGGSSSPSPRPAEENVNAEIGFEGLQLGEFRVGYNEDSGAPPAVAVAPDGRFVIVWTGNDGNGAGIYAQRYNSQGMAQGPSFLVNQEHTEDNQESPAVAINSAGNFVITWEDEDNQDIYARSYNSQGVADGNEFRVNVEDRDYGNPDVALNDNNHFVLSWGHEGEFGGDIYARRYGSGYSADSSEFQVNTNSQFNINSSVAMDGDGDFVVAWHTYSDSIQARYYGSSGNIAGSEFQVNTVTGGLDDENADVAMNAAGQFVIAWQSEDGSDWGIDARRYNSTATALDGSEFQVNTTTSYSQFSPQVALDSDGDFMVAWNDYNQFGIFAQRYTSAGVAVNSEFKVSVTQYATSGPGLALDGDGSAVVAWPYYESIYAKRYNSNGQVQ